ncbi:GntR family transcriptional regulator [Methylobacterium aquaticum]|uniref:GntR family transcriptional regulator n=1 Tax=Methylobacterium aquaticum TaxID=270351 RepID=UPI00069CD8BD|nr:GntR family transcriptional regulator [Methylobacterium aquaticum]
MRGEADRAVAMEAETGALDEAAVHAVLARALLDGRIPAGTKLGEHFLAEIFGVSRERVRKVLHRLGHERLITVEKNRGAFAIAPDLEEARTVYEARRILEGGIVGHLATALDDAGEARLAAHIAAEEAAMTAGDRFTSIRLSAEFHTILADLTGNPLIRRQMQELVARTMMLVAFFEPDTSVACQCAEHRAVFRALGGRSRAQAVRAMTTHLSLVETRLRPRVCEAVPPPLDEVLRDALALWRTRNGPAARPDPARRPSGLAS